MQLTPVIAIHMSAALGALVTGPIALWARSGAKQRPRLHRAFGYAWVTLMLASAVSALFIRDFQLPNIGGYTPIHLLVPLTLFSLLGAFRALAQGNIARHRAIMRNLYLGACVVAGAFTLLPQRYLGQLVWGQLRGLLPILQGTPVWVWALLAGLVVLGLSQARERSVGLGRSAVMPVAMTGFSLWGLAGAFGASPWFGLALALWITAATGVFALVARLPSRARYDAATRSFTVPGSWVPLALILAIFLVRYAVNVQLVLAPQRIWDAGFTLGCAAVYGALSGIFAGRAAALWRLAAAPRAGTPALAH